MNHGIHLSQYQGLFTLRLVQEFYLSKGLIKTFACQNISNSPQILGVRSYKMMAPQNGAISAKRALFAFPIKEVAVHTQAWIFKPPYSVDWYCFQCEVVKNFYIFPTLCKIISGWLQTFEKKNQEQFKNIPRTFKNIISRK